MKSFLTGALVMVNYVTNYIELNKNANGNLKTKINRQDECGKQTKKTLSFQHPGEELTETPTTTPILQHFQTAPIVLYSAGCRGRFYSDNWC